MWYIGQKIVCIKQHSDPECPLVKDNTYTIFDIFKCSCGKISFNIGFYLPVQAYGIQCSYCGLIRDNINIWYLGSDLFRPLDYLIISNKELIENFIEEKSDLPVKQPQTI